MNVVLRPESPIRTYSREYRNRIAIPMEKDFFERGMRAFLEGNRIFFARVPVEQTKEVYYFFGKRDETNKLEEVEKFLAEQERLEGSATV